jgi:protein-tyrosine phosphatase
VGYAGLGAAVFGKRRDGQYQTWALVLHLPYLLSTLVVWYLIRLAIAENAADEVSPGLWVARRPLGFEVPDGVECIVDVTAEFWVARGTRHQRQYICYPTLDGHVCDDVSFDAMVGDVAGLRGSILIHCAQGHGRSAALAAAVLLARGAAASVEEAERILISRRAKVALKKSQRMLVELWWHRHRSGGRNKVDPHCARTT